jgi:hypothetical protein
LFSLFKNPFADKFFWLEHPTKHLYDLRWQETMEFGGLVEGNTQ